MKEITKEEIGEILKSELEIDMNGKNSLCLNGVEQAIDKIHSLINKPEPKKFEVWKPKDGQSYKYINEYGVVTLTNYGTDYYHERRYELGNVFQPNTGKAERHLLHLKAKKKLQDELAVMNAEANGGVALTKSKTYLQYDTDTNQLSSSTGWITNFPLHESLVNTFDYHTTIGTLTEEEVRLAFGVFE